jgi:hypothetical protein
MQRNLLGTLIVALAACGGPTSPSQRTDVITGSLSSVDHPMAADHKFYSVEVSQSGVLSASIRWVGSGAVWVFVFDAQPPTNHEPLASNVTSHATSISASVVAGTYWILLSQEQVVAGPDKGACGCVDDFTLTLTYP